MLHPRTHKQTSHNYRSRPFFSKGSQGRETAPFFSAQNSSPVATFQPKHEVADQQELEEVQTQGHESDREIPQYSAGETPLPPSEPNSGLKIQAKLTIGQPNDQYEQEADRVAEQLMRMPEPRIQRRCPKCKEELRRQPMVDKEEEERTLQTKPLAEQITQLVQRQAEPIAEEEKTLQTKTSSSQPSTVSSSLQNQISALQGGGQPLPHSERAFFEPRFGTDFSQVRVHTDSQAVETASAVNARAFTVGQNIVFGTAQYQPSESEGRRLLAHELTHVVQQNGGQQHNQQTREGKKLIPHELVHVIQQNSNHDQVIRRINCNPIPGYRNPNPRHRIHTTEFGRISEPDYIEHGTSLSRQDYCVATGRIDRSYNCFAFSVDNITRPIVPGGDPEIDWSDVADFYRQYDFYPVDRSDAEDAEVVLFGHSFQNILHASRRSNYILPWESKLGLAHRIIHRLLPLQGETYGHVLPWGFSRRRPPSPRLPTPTFQRPFRPAAVPQVQRQLNVREPYHIAQQEQSPPEIIQRSGFRANEGWARRASGIGTYRTEELLRYLRGLRWPNGVEGRIDSDNKARAIVNMWRMGLPGSPFHLNAQRKTLLIKEMLAVLSWGFVLNDDEQAILEVLERSDNSELRVIFGSDGINASDLERKFQGDERRRLGEFFFRRFEGGMIVVLSGRIIPREEVGPISRGVELPRSSVTPRVRELALEAQGQQDCSWRQRCAESTAGSVPGGIRSIVLSRWLPCCTPRMLQNITDMRRRAVDKVHQAVILLSSSPRSVGSQLRQHFRVDDRDRQNILRIVNQLELILDALRRQEVIYLCRDEAHDSMCSNEEGRRVGGTTLGGCTDISPRYMKLCGNYQQCVREHSPFFHTPRHLHTLIHEYVHASCIPEGLEILGRRLLPEPYRVREFYSGEGEGAIYPPPHARYGIRNPDSYTNFVLAVT